MLCSLILISLIGRVQLNMDEHQTAHCNADTLRIELKGKTSQSSDYTHGVAYSSERAINEDENNCSHTLKDSNSWWSIDLLGVYSINCVKIFNKQHHHADITGAQIYIGNSSEKSGTSNRMFKNINTFKMAAWNHFPIDPNVSGRYITVYFPKNMFLILCQVQIFGTIKESPFLLIRENKTWEDALYHCRDQNMELASIVDEETQTWAELEANNSDTPFVWLGLRYTCALNFWFWVEDLPLKFNHWAPNGKIEECNMSGAMEKGGNQFWFSKSATNRFYFICAK